MTIQEVKAIWTGFPGAPGYSTFYRVAPAQPAAIRAFFDACKTLLPLTVDVQVQNTGNLINEVTGQVTGSWSSAAVSVVTGTYGGTYQGPSGFVANWLTDLYVAGRRLKGKTYMVPAAVGDTDGSLTTTGLALVRAAASALVTTEAGQLLVWHRPVPPATSGGQVAAVTSATVPDLVAVLRSRRQ